MLQLTKESDRRKPIVWIDAGIHAREWIAPSTALFVIHRLAEPTARDEDAERFLDQFDWYIVPVLNPDGYVHSWRKDRFWRKNRSTPRTRPFRYPWTVFSDCVGKLVAMERWICTRLPLFAFRGDLYAELYFKVRT